MKIKYSFWFLIIYSLFLGYFNELIIFLLCLMIHEIGHLIIAFIFKFKINYFKLSIFGGEMNFYLNNVAVFKKILLFANGIIFNIIFLMLAFLLNSKLLIKCNLILIVVNCIPLVPLDGFNILSLFLPETILTNLSLILLFSISLIAIYKQSLGLFLIAVFLIINFVQYLKLKNEKRLYIIIKNMI